MRASVHSVIYSLCWLVATVSLFIGPLLAMSGLSLASFVQQKRGEKEAESSKILWIFWMLAEEARCADWAGFFFFRIHQGLWMSVFSLRSSNRELITSQLPRALWCCAYCIVRWLASAEARTPYVPQDRIVGKCVRLSGERGVAKHAGRDVPGRHASEEPAAIPSRKNRSTTQLFEMPRRRLGSPRLSASRMHAIDDVKRQPELGTLMDR